MLLGLPAGHARHFFGDHLHNGGAFFCREIENGKFLLHTVPKVDAMRGLFVCNVSFSDAAKIGDAPLCRFAIDAHILDQGIAPSVNRVAFLFNPATATYADCYLNSFKATAVSLPRCRPAAENSRRNRFRPDPKRSRI